MGVRGLRRKKSIFKTYSKCGLEKLFLSNCWVLAGTKGALLSFLVRALWTLYQIKLALQTLEILEKQYSIQIKGL